MINYILIANTSQSTIDYPDLVGVMLLLVGGILYVRYVLSGMCVDGRKHDWEYHVWNDPVGRQIRWCSKCMVRQSRPSDDWGWGRDGLHVAGDDEL